MIKVIPAIIPETFGQLKKEISLVKDFVPLVQIDILDGIYTPTKTWPFNEERSFLEEEIAKGKGEALGIGFELDLMIKNPEDTIDKWIGMKPEVLIIHFESVGSRKKLEEIINKIKLADVKIGIALKPSTSNEEIYPLIRDIDFIQFMGNDKIGYHGVELDEKVYDKVKELHKRYPDITIAVDIGVNKKTAPKLIEAGVNKLVSGSTIFNSENIKESISYFKNLK